MNEPSAPEEKRPDVEIGAKTGNTVTYTVKTPQEAARAAELEVSGEGDLHSVGVQAGDKVSFTTISKGGTTSYESAAELSGVAKGLAAVS